MRNRATRLVAWAIAAVAATPLIALAQPPEGGNAAEEAAILKNAGAFVGAFEKGDAKAVTAFWAADGDYTDMKGKRVSGQKELEKSFAAFFAESKGAKLRIEVEGLRFVTPEVAIEDGLTSVLVPDAGPPSRAKYTMVHVKKDGKWLIHSVRETPYAPPGNAEKLGGLEGVIGSWAAEADGGDVARISFDWSLNQNFIVATFTTSFKNIEVGGGTQWIGWDAAAKGVRSWSFLANGGFGEGTWKQDGKSWTIQSTATTPDGKKITATEVVTAVDADTVTVLVKDRTLDGKPLPGGKEVKFKRVK